MSTFIFKLLALSLPFPTLGESPALRAAFPVEDLEIWELYLLG